MKKQIFLWSLYDFANSIVMMAFLFYFSQWLVIERGAPAWWYNLALIFSSILFLITAPSISFKIDSNKILKINGLRFWTIITLISYLIISILVMLGLGFELFLTILFAFATYAYLTCFLYFTPMLNDLSNEKDRTFVSGLGQASNSVGQVFGILIILPFVNGITLFGDPGRAQALLPATIIFGVLILPMLLFYKENKVKNEFTENGGVEEGKIIQRAEHKTIKSVFLNVFSYKPLAIMFLAYFLFSDSLITFTNNFPLYLETVHHVGDTSKSILTALILILAGVGAIIFGKIANKIGDIKTLKIVLWVWVFIFLSAILIDDFKILLPIFCVAGLFFGPIWSVSRSIVGNLAPKHLVASSYSYYVVAERFATLIGPGMWSLALIFWGEGILGYKMGLASLMILIVLSLIVLRKLRDDIIKV